MVHIKVKMFMENGSDFCSSLDNNDYYMDIIHAAMDGSHQNCSITNLKKTYCKAKNYTPRMAGTPKKGATPQKPATPKKAKSPKKEKTKKSKTKSKTESKNNVDIKIDIELKCNPCQIGELTQKGTPRRTHTPKSQGKGHRYVKNDLDFMLNGFAHEGYIKSRTYSQYCGSPTSPLPKGQKSCSKYTIILI